MVGKGCERGFKNSISSLILLLKNLQIRMLYVLFDRHERTVISRRE